MNSEHSNRVERPASDAYVREVHGCVAFAEDDLIFVPWAGRFAFFHDLDVEI